MSPEIHSRNPLTTLPSGDTFVAMGSKLTAEQFISDFFRDRTATLKRRLEVHQVFRKPFHQNDCKWDGRNGVAERSESEKICSISTSDLKTSVITTGSVYRSRYQLKPDGGSWLIAEIEMECSLCSNGGLLGECRLCGGKGWMNQEDRRALLQSTAKNNALVDLPAEEESADRHFDPSAIEKFMADYFQERTVSRKKEFKIQEEHANRFYDPLYDWTESLPNPECEETERILSITPTNSEVRVITTGVPTLRLRYHLLPMGESWLIGMVKLQCPNCRQQGRNTNCFLCGGTIWERTKRNEKLPRQNPPDPEPHAENSRWQP